MVYDLPPVYHDKVQTVFNKAAWFYHRQGRPPMKWPDFVGVSTCPDGACWADAAVWPDGQVVTTPAVARDIVRLAGAKKRRLSPTDADAARVVLHETLHLVTWKSTECQVELQAQRDWRRFTRIILKRHGLSPYLDTSFVSYGCAM